MQQNQTKPISQREIERLLDVLKDGPDMNTVVMDMDDFRRRILPILKTAGDNFDHEQWVREAGSMFTAVRVVGDNGEIIYDIPAPLRTNEYDYTRADRIRDHAEELRQIRQISPERYSAIMYEGLRDRTIVYDQDKEAVEFAELLVRIFTDHNVPLPAGLSAFVERNGTTDTTSPAVVEESTSNIEEIDEIP